METSLLCVGSLHDQCLFCLLDNDILDSNYTTCRIARKIERKLETWLCVLSLSERYSWDFDYLLLIRCSIGMAVGCEEVIVVAVFCQLERDAWLLLIGNDGEADVISLACHDVLIGELCSDVPLCLPLVGRCLWQIDGVAVAINLDFWIGYLCPAWSIIERCCSMTALEP